VVVSGDTRFDRVAILEDNGLDAYFIQNNTWQ
jgi:hypothetical protein